MSDTPEKAHGYVSLLYSIAERPLDLWSKRVSLGGRVRRIRDDTLHGDRVIEITGPHDCAVPTNVAIPAGMLDALNIKLPVLVLIIKNVNLRFRFEVQIVDEKRYRRRFSFMTYNLEKLPRIGTDVARIPLRLEECWNSLEIDLHALCREAYGTDYEALQRLVIYSNCHLRRVYLQSRHYGHDEIPVDMYQAFLDMYMSKWGLNSVDGTCQTEERRGELLQQFRFKRSVRNNVAGVSLRKLHSSKNVCSTGKLDNLNLSNTTAADVNNLNALQRKYMSLDTLNGAINKMHDKRNVVKNQSECFGGSPIIDATAESKPRDNNVGAKKEIRDTTKSHKSENPSRASVNMKCKDVLHATVSFELERVAKSEFLKMHVGETLFGTNKSSIYSHLHRIRDAGDLHGLDTKTSTARNDGDDVQAENNVHFTDKKCEILPHNFPLSEFNPSKDVTKFEHRVNNDSSGENKKSYITLKDKYTKEN